MKHVRKQGLPASYQTTEDRILHDLSDEQQRERMRNEVERLRAGGRYALEFRLYDHFCGDD